MTFVKRPVAVITLSFFISFCVLLNFESIDKRVILAVSAAVFCVFLVPAILIKRIRVFAIYVLIASIAVHAASLYAISFSEGDDMSHLCDGTSECTATVAETGGASSYYHSYIANVKISESGEEFKTILSGAEEYEIGDILKADVAFYLPEEDAVFDEKSYCLSLGVRVKGDIESAEVIGKDTDSFSLKIKRLNMKLSDILHRGLEGDAAEIADAVVLGNKSNLSNEITRDFSRLGISHLLAISGMHISFICSGFTFIMRKIRVNRKIISLLTVLLMLFYMALTGFSPSVVRASVLCIMMSIIYIIGISYDGMTCLGVCGCIMVFVDPFCAYSVGMQLSYCSYIGCLASVSATEKLGIASNPSDGVIKKFALRTLSSALFTVFVVCFTMPVSWLYFGTTSIAAPLTNLIFIPAFSLVLYISVAVIILSPVPFLFGVISKIGTVYINLILKLSSLISSMKGITVSTKYDFSPYILAALAALVVLSAVLCSKKSRICQIGIIFLVAVYALGIVRYNANLGESTEVTRCIAKGGEALILIGDGTCSVVDFSAASRSSIKREIHYSEERCATEINSFVVTRYSGSTPEGIEYLASASFVDTVYLPVPRGTEREICFEIKEFLSSKGIAVKEYNPNKDILTLGNSKLTVGLLSDGTSSKKTVCAKVEGQNETLVFLGKGWNKSRGRVEKDYSPYSCDYLFLGSSGNASAPYSLITDAEIYLFSDSEDKSKNLIPSLKEERIYGASSAVTVRLK